MLSFNRSFLLSTLAFLIVALGLNVIGNGCQGTQRTGDEAPPQPNLAPTVILISLDGFRSDYFDRYEAPTLRRLADEGVRSEGMMPSFPSKTFPNHYTVVTGLYPENHGIVANTMYDPEFDASFSMGNRAAVRDGRWWGGEPIWVTLEQQGQKSAPFFWPGSEAEIKGTRPSYWLPFDNSLPARARIDKVLAWLELPAKERPTFITLYYSNVDTQGHRHGPDSDEAAQAVRDVDTYLGWLVEGLEAHGFYDQVNLIVVADHGMAPTSSERVVFLDDYINLDDVRVVDYDPVAMIRPKEGKLETVYEALKQAQHVSFYKKEEIPEDLHFQAHRRIPALVGVADEGWRITSRDFFNQNPGRFDGGAHGYDHRLASMRALFIGRGPAFVEGLMVEPFANIHVYNLMASILNVEPAPNDGDLDAVQHLLRPIGNIP